ncbi:hypothetical protein [Brevundimonas sp.]|uniref:hypothetical protein n=1 Tax=Brevundimonas sp. TaxID=1871086 RepID=UPI002D4EB58F|nr:hypothetical protein [Brevundimonas sp.]HYC96626.1 hypothetical protein [Brevundimonas sp.]
MKEPPMHTRRPAFRDRRRRFIRALQRVRLEGLETGAYEPLTDRERMYLELRRRGRAPDIEDFILSEAMLLLERVAEGLTGGEKTSAP